MQNLKSVLRQSLKKDFSEIQSELIVEMQRLDSGALPEKEQHKIVKVLMLCMLGSFFGHHTLKSVLRAYDVKSTKLYTIYNRLSYKDLSQISLQLFKFYVTKELQHLGNQSSSSWSRALATIVIDASVYKQWLKNTDCKFFGKYYSGQTGKPEYGFRLTLGGITINDTFYPLIFNILPKHIADDEIASNMLLEIQSIVNQISIQHNLTLGQWYLSVDSAYSSNILLDTATQAQIIPICVPKMNNIFIIGKQRTNLSEYIDTVFIEQEKQYNLTHSATDEPFTLRIRAYFRTLDREVILLFFRYNHSNKVSVIYSTHLSIKKETLRQHWFQRTYIEQFFRFSKHTLKAPQSTASTIIGFVRKICLNFMKTIFCLTVRNDFRKHHRCFKNWTFGTISTYVTTHRIGEQWLTDLLDLQDTF